MKRDPEHIGVLYVDDDPATTASVSETLESANEQITVRTATTVAEGVEILATEAIDCVVAEYNLADRSGLEFLESVRERHGDLPFVLYTADGSEAVASEAISAGVTGYIRKDDAEQAEKVVDEVLAAVENRQTELDRRRQLDAIESAQEGISILDEDGRFIFVNEAYADLYGYDPEQMLGEHWELVYPEDDIPEIYENVIAAVEEDGHWRGTTTGLRADGTTFIEDHVLALTENDELICTVRDITERKQREQVLREMYEIISDRGRSFEGKVRSLLDLGQRELGTEYGTLSQIQGEEYLFEVVAGEDKQIREGDRVPLEATNCERVAETERTIVLGNIERDAPEETNRAGYTEMGIYSYIGAPVYVENDIRGTFCFYDTEPRSDEFSEWEQTLVDLMSRWVSHELQHRVTTERLQAKNEQLERFASIVSHDLRNPLNVASLRLNLAMDNCDSEHLNEVEQAHERMERLIENLLNLALEGEAVSETEAVEISDVIEHCRQTVDIRSGAVKLVDSRTIEADRERLQQLVENLVRNAIDHGGDGVTITVGTLDNGFYVEDDGPGIDAEDREEVFEPGVSTNDDGTGFGLSIVRQIADAHGWGLTVTDGPTGGARFEITGVEFVDRD